MTRCRKRRFRTRIDAQMALLRTQAKADRGHPRRHERRYYRCPHCAGWHLTSRERSRNP